MTFFFTASIVPAVPAGFLSENRLESKFIRAGVRFPPRSVDVAIKEKKEGKKENTPIDSPGRMVDGNPNVRFSFFLLCKQHFTILRDYRDYRRRINGARLSGERRRLYVTRAELQPNRCVRRTELGMILG